MKQNDKTRAKHLLTLRDKGGGICWGYFYKSKVLWFAAIMMVVFTAGAIMSPDDLVMNRFMFCFLGILIGRILRDIMWLKSIADGFPFTEKVVNWDKVARLAEEG